MNTDFKIIPAGWRLSTVGRECKICNSLREPLSEEERATMQGSYPYYGPTKAVDYLDHFRVEGTYALIGEDGDHFLKYNNQDMTQLVCGRFNVNNHAHIVKGGPDCSTEWFYTFFRQRSIAPFLTRQGAGRFKLNKAALEKIPMLVPPTTEQAIIHSSITRWDRSIDLTKSLIAAKQERRTWLMQQLLTGKKRLPGFHRQWPEVHLRDIFKPVRRKNKKGATHVLTASGEHGLVDQTEYFNRSVSGESLEGYFLLRRGEFAYNRSSMNGYPFGAIKRLDDYEEGVLSTLYICFELTSRTCSSDFYKHLFEAGVINKQLHGIVQVGARAHGLLNVTLEDFFSIKVKCPPKEEQEKIAAVIDVADRELGLLSSQLNALREQKKGLMQQLLTGNVRVTV